jgi:hypothetical protein
LHWPAKNRLGCFEQASGVVTLDPLAEKRIRNADFQRIAFSAEPQPNGLTEPKAKPCRTQTLGHGRAQSRFHNGKPLDQGLSPCLILLLTVYRHDALPTSDAR